MCPTAPAPVNQGVANVAGHDPAVSAPTAPTTAVRFSGLASQSPVCISSPALRPDGFVARFSDSASRSRRVSLRVTHGFSSYFPEPRSPCSWLAHAHCSVARGLNTRAHISPYSPRCFILDSGTTEPARSTCILRAARLNSTAGHFFPPFRPTCR
jgi:hypothetical protein